ncbi:hypothetical protein BKA62DRAFT_617557 [Auriculariales sp. MPI-PUGE-AT-0066]|nr:hypothetical protein BKA62DRAFT_617557 [Auriculariales sp. MPI-PUGE-AT-0066]
MKACFDRHCRSVSFTLCSGFLKKASSAMGGKIWATYNWGANKPDEADAAGVPFIPMLWGPKTFDDWGVVKKGYAKAALGCNEVNQNGQAQMSVSDGVAAWKKYLAPLIDDGYTLYSHSVSNAPSGLEWWDSFKDQCAECHNQIGAMAVHYYSNSADGMIAYLEEVHSRYGKNLVVTEFGCANWSGQGAVSDGCSQSETEAFYRTVTAYMDKSGFVVGYLGFGFFTTSDPSGGVPSANAFYNGDGSFTDVGKAYAY